MKFNIIEIIFLLIIIFTLRYIIFEIWPELNINGYLFLFISILVFSYGLTMSILFSTIMGLLSIIFRILYKSFIPNEITNLYNSKENLIICCIGFFLLFLFLINFNYINNNFKMYYNITLIVLITILLYLHKEINNGYKCIP